MNLLRRVTLEKTGSVVRETAVVLWEWACSIVVWLWLQQRSRLNDVAVVWCHGIHLRSLEGAVSETARVTCVMYDGRVESLSWNCFQKSDAWCCECASNDGEQTHNDLKEK